MCLCIVYASAQPVASSSWTNYDITAFMAKSQNKWFARQTDWRCLVIEIKLLNWRMFHKHTMQAQTVIVKASSRSGIKHQILTIIIITIVITMIIVLLLMAIMAIKMLSTPRSRPVTSIFNARPLSPPANKSGKIQVSVSIVNFPGFSDIFYSRHFFPLPDLQLFSSRHPPYSPLAQLTGGPTASTVFRNPYEARSSRIKKNRNVMMTNHHLYIFRWPGQGR